MPRAPAIRAPLFATAVVGMVLAASCVIGVVEEADENRRGGADKPEPPPALPELSFEADTVLDRSTRLVWQRIAAPERLTFAQAGDYCRDLGLQGGGWRLPSRDELLTVLRHRQDPFGAPLDWYWSGSPGVRPDTAWAVGINSWMNGNPVLAKSRARCVKTMAGSGA